MKKLFLSTLILGLIVSCNKGKTISDIDNISGSTLENTNTKTITDLKIYQPDEVTDFLNKKNDTLYVTNFFATWCGPCVREIPHFKEKMEKMKGQPVKFTFISVDDKQDWETKVKNFGIEHGISEQIILLDAMTLTSDFMTKNFKKWDGSAIPFTFIRKGDKTDETLGMMSQEMLEQKINSIK